MKQFLILLLIAIAYAAEPTIDPANATIKKGTASKITFDYGTETVTNKKIFYQKPDKSFAELGSCALEGSKFTSTGITMTTAGKYDLYLQADANDNTGVKLKQQLTVADQNVIKVSKAKILADTSENLGFTLLFTAETGDDAKVGYLDGTTNKLFTTCTKATNVVTCPVKIVNKATYKITFGAVDSGVTLEIASNYLTVSLAIIFSLFLF